MLLASERRNGFLGSLLVHDNELILLAGYGPLGGGGGYGPLWGGVDPWLENSFSERVFGIGGLWFYWLAHGPLGGVWTPLGGRVDP